MTILEHIYRLTHKSAIEKGDKVPYYWKYSILTVIAKPIRKYFSVVIIPNIPFNGLRVWAYRRCGFKIGKRVFIGMKCYLDDLCYDKITIDDDATVSYGVYFACHGRKQGHNAIHIGKDAYIGMRAMIVARQNIEIGDKAIVGAGTLVNKSIPAGSVSVGIPCRITPPLNSSFTWHYKTNQRMCS